MSSKAQRRGSDSRRKRKRFHANQYTRNVSDTHAVDCISASAKKLCKENYLDKEGKKETLEWCMKANLIASRYECRRCKKNMRLQKRKVDGYEWRCRNQSKDNRHDVVRSVRKGTWFSESKLAITIILHLTRYWFGKSMNAFVVNDLKVNKNMTKLIRHVAAI
ncbi:hypothetical protein TNCV_559971 [Trichonephila clavipes]|nr:hypothetical protein TNCV_559971 [Trichonephila clavipes]